MIKKVFGELMIMGMGSAKPIDISESAQDLALGKDLADEAQRRQQETTEIDELDLACNTYLYNMCEQCSPDALIARRNLSVRDLPKDLSDHYILANADDSEIFSSGCGWHPIYSLEALSPNNDILPVEVRLVGGGNICGMHLGWLKEYIGSKRDRHNVLAWRLVDDRYLDDKFKWGSPPNEPGWEPLCTFGDAIVNVCKYANANEIAELQHNHSIRRGRKVCRLVDLQFGNGEIRRVNLANDIQQWLYYINAWRWSDA